MFIMIFGRNNVKNINNNNNDNIKRAGLAVML
jgi:hypothetical protein